MKKLLLACLISAPAIQAQVIECPKFYPWQDTPLSEVPYGHKGMGMVAKGRLTGGSMYRGDPKDRSDVMGEYKKVKAATTSTTASERTKTSGFSARTLRMAMVQASSGGKR